MPIVTQAHSLPRSQATSNENNTVYDAKRLIGRLFGDPQLQKDLPHFPFKVIQVDGKPQIVLHRGKTELRMPPEEVCVCVRARARVRQPGSLRVRACVCVRVCVHPLVRAHDGSVLHAQTHVDCVSQSRDHFCT